MISQVVLSKILKGVFSAGVAFLGTLGASLSGTSGFGDVTAQQWVFVASATLTAFGGTFGLAGWAGPEVGTHPRDGG